MFSFKVILDGVCGNIHLYVIHKVCILVLFSYYNLILCRKTTSSTEVAARDQAVNDKLAELESQITALNDRVTKIENRYPYVSTERNVLNTFVFVAWLSLPVLFWYYYHKYRR